MTQVSTDEVRQLARLSNLQLSDDEITRLQGEISHILAYIEQLGELDTSGVEPTYQVSGLQNIWREDEVAPQDVTRDQLIALAPEAQDHQIKVPRVL